MQTMTALVRIDGNLAMTVKVHDVTPAEAWLLMHVHDPDTKDVFEQARLTADVHRSKTEERDRLAAKYDDKAKLIETLFPGRSAHDVPDTFAELEGTPLELGAARHAAPGIELVDDATVGEVYQRPREPAPMTDEQTRAALLGSKKPARV
jgi:hypothetical protein